MQHLFITTDLFWIPPDYIILGAVFVGNSAGFTSCSGFGASRENTAAATINTKYRKSGQVSLVVQDRIVHLNIQ